MGLTDVSLTMLSDVEQLFLSVGTCVPSLDSIYSHIHPTFYTVVFVLICMSVVCILDISLFSHI